LVGLSGFVSQKVYKHTFCRTHFVTHIITTIHVLNGFQQVPVVVLCINNVIQSQVDKCVNFDKVLLLEEFFSLSNTGPFV